MYVYMSLTPLFVVGTYSVYSLQNHIQRKVEPCEREIDKVLQ